MIVRSLMKSSPAKLMGSAKLSEALDVMADQKVRHIVVVDETDLAIGILSDRDLAMYYDPVEMTQEKWDQSSVKDLMTTEPLVIGSGTEIGVAAKMLLESAVSALPVVDNGLLVGILSESDFVRYFAEGEKS